MKRYDASISSVFIDEEGSWEAVAGRLLPHQNSDVFLKDIGIQTSSNFICPKAKQTKSPTSSSTSYHISLLFQYSETLQCFKLVFNSSPLPLKNTTVRLSSSILPKLLSLKQSMLTLKDYSDFIVSSVFSCVKHFSVVFLPNRPGHNPH